MDSYINSTKAFTDAIQHMAAQECKKIDDETEEIRRQRLRDISSHTKIKYNEYVEYELKRIDAQKNREISDIEEDSKRELTSLRIKLENMVFQNVVKEIEKFTSSDKYIDYLVNDVKEILESMENGEELRFFMRDKDLSFTDEINKNLGTNIVFNADKSIVYGGVRAEGVKTGNLADDTIDVKLQQEKEWFVEHSGLKI